ncbi:hypothetical protein MMMB2_4629 [Mycobacterium marinum MB2]|nr:hypothetical protein MMMB2_4629 [Mycobacterium marinum MB2]
MVDICCGKFGDCPPVSLGLPLAGRLSVCTGSRVSYRADLAIRTIFGRFFWRIQHVFDDIYSVHTVPVACCRSRSLQSHGGSM